jgi:hypothetical protein
VLPLYQWVISEQYEQNLYPRIMVLTGCDVVLCSFEDEYKHIGAVSCLQLQGRTVKMNVAVTNSCNTNKSTIL